MKLQHDWLEILSDSARQASVEIPEEDLHTTAQILSAIRQTRPSSPSRPLWVFGPLTAAIIVVVAFRLWPQTEEVIPQSSLAKAPNSAEVSWEELLPLNEELELEEVPSLLGHVPTDFLLADSALDEPFNWSQP